MAAFAKSVWQKLATLSQSPDRGLSVAPYVWLAEGAEVARVELAELAKSSCVRSCPANLLPQPETQRPSADATSHFTNLAFSSFELETGATVTDISASTAGLSTYKQESRVSATTRPRKLTFVSFRVNVTNHQLKIRTYWKCC